ncbi:FtsX-like permease family protein [Patescibacteria group bacterium]|nr:FtsX-like permease family protein [Patescibacteria group bacterium]
MNTHEIKTAAFLAYKSILRGSRSTAVLLVFIISLSYLNILFVSGMLFGLQDLMVRSIINLFSAHVTISAQQEPRVKAYIPDQGDLRAEIETIPGVIATSRHYLLAGSIGFDKLKNGVFKYISGAIVAIHPEEEKRVLSLHTFLIDGEWLEPTDHDQIVLSSALAGGYGLFAPSDLGGVRVGDKVRIVFANEVSRPYTVKGIYNDAIGLFETFITVEEAESILSTHNEATQILVKADVETTSLDTLVRRIEDVAPNLKIQPYTVLLGSFAAFLSALDLISAIVSVISVLVAAITMFVLIYVNAINKRRQIGILKAIGIKSGIIVMSYLFQSLFYSFCGVLIGYFFVFYVLTPFMYANPIDVIFGYLSPVYSETAIIAGIVSLLVASLLAGLIPAWLVARAAILKSLSR